MCNHVIFPPCTDRGDMKHVVQSFFLSENALTFTAPATKSIQILDDHTDDDVGFEEPEYFELALVTVSDSPQIVFDPAIANVNILDDEGNDITFVIEGTMLHIWLHITLIAILLSSCSY